MITEYIRAAMRQATYELMNEGEGFLGRVPACPGVWANEPTLEACRAELESVLDDWIWLKLRHDDRDFQVIDGHDLNPPPPQVDPADAALAGAGLVDAALAGAA